MSTESQVTVEAVDFKLVRHLAQMNTDIEEIAEELRKTRDAENFHPPKRRSGILLPSLARAGEMTANATLAIRHLEDAAHRVRGILKWYHKEGTC